MHSNDFKYFEIPSKETLVLEVRFRDCTSSTALMTSGSPRGCGERPRLPFPELPIVEGFAEYVEQTLYYAQKGYSTCAALGCMNYQVEIVTSARTEKCEGVSFKNVSLRSLVLAAYITAVIVPLTATVAYAGCLAIS